MVHSRDTAVLLERNFEVSAQAAEHSERWPVPQAAMFITVASSLCWVGIIALARWLIG